MRSVPFALADGLMRDPARSLFVPSAHADGTDTTMAKIFRVGILGATGVVGQRFIQLLQNHPQFEVAALAASDRSQGKTYAEACTWRLPGDMPDRVRQIIVQAPAPPLDCDFIFSSLPGEIAIGAEPEFSRAGYPVISNSSSHRMAADVPLLIPEVNPEHLELIEAQRAASSTA